MIAAGITTLYDEEKLFIAVGLYFISKGFFVVSLTQKMHQNIKDNCSADKSNP
jgi:hypothetical protein